MLGGSANVVVQPEFQPVVVEQVDAHPVVVVAGVVEGSHCVSEQGIREVAFFSHFLDFGYNGTRIDHGLGFRTFRTGMKWAVNIAVRGQARVVPGARSAPAEVGFPVEPRHEGGQELRRVEEVGD